MFPCLGRAVFPASEGPRYLHWKVSFFSIRIPPSPALPASRWPPAGAWPTAPRIADAELLACLGSAGAVVIEGPKACGKSRLAQQLAASTVLLDVDIAARQALAVDPALVLAGPRPRLLDEWQVEPALWNQVRRAVDAVEAPGQFLLTGSAVPADDAERHTGAGRLSFLRLRPMSLVESGAGQGGVSLAALLAG
jgi:hypothetical protein